MRQLGLILITLGILVIIYIRLIGMDLSEHDLFINYLTEWIMSTLLIILGVVLVKIGDTK